MTEFEQLNPNANVRIYMKGLGIAHHNSGKWEFLFLRTIPEHDLKIVVKEFRVGLDPKFPVETVYPIPTDVERLEIETTNSVPMMSSHHKPSGNNFRARRGFDDVKESRWIIDLSEELHGKPIKLARKNFPKPENHPIPLTFLTVNDAVFYTATLSKRPYSITFNDNYCFSRVVGQWMGFDIEWADMGQTAIKFNSSLINDIVLERDPKISRYEIEINNDCCAGDLRPQSDFHYYYDYLVDMPGEIFDEDVSLPTNKSNFLTNSITAESDAELSGTEAFFKLLGSLLGGKEDDCHLAQVTRLVDGISSLEDLL